MYAKYDKIDAKELEKYIPVSPSPYSAIESVSLSGDCFSLPNLFAPPSLIKESGNTIFFHQ